MFDKVYGAKRLNNWELPKWYPPRPRQRRGSTKVIADDAGHLLPTAKRPDNNPWGNFRSTYQLPDRLTRRFGEEYNECLLRRDKWRKFQQRDGAPACPQDPNNNEPPLGVTGTAALPGCQTKCETAERLLSSGKDTTRLLGACEGQKKPLDLEYVPGDFTPPQQQHPSRRLLLEQKFERDHGIEPELPLDKLYLGDHGCDSAELRPSAPSFTPAVPLTRALTPPDPLTRTLTPPVTPPLPLSRKDFAGDADAFASDSTKMPYGSITEKPNERCPSPVVPAYANFELAKRMHQDNLDHQPLPDCVADLAYRKLQISGASPGLALDLDPIATGVGVKTHNVGPTHCTKMKVFRPKTCGVVPKVYSTDEAYRPFSSTDPAKKMGAMDLAICWDYKPANPADEPQRPRHIDGSNDSAGPAVFTFVKTPRDDADASGDVGRSAGVFTSTLGEPGFFDKDIMRRRTDFVGRNIDRDPDCDCGPDAYASDPPPHRARSVSRDFGELGMPSKHGKLYKSSPNVMNDQEYKSLREKYLGRSTACLAAAPGPACKRSNPGFLRRTRSRLCHKVAPAEPSCCMRPEDLEPRMPCKAAFRAGLPKYNAAGAMVSSDSGCSVGSCPASRVVVVPRPRNPYIKKNYDIDTLVPPFRSHAGGAGQGGYPEHWRLASVYQHAFKPLEQRRRPLLQTVYK